MIFAAIQLSHRSHFGTSAAPRVSASLSRRSFDPFPYQELSLSCPGLAHDVYQKQDKTRHRNRNGKPKARIRKYGADCSAERRTTDTGQSAPCSRSAHAADGSVTRLPASTERKRVETVVETLATLRSHGEALAEVAHDARNMVTALGLYCDLLEEPGVLASLCALRAGTASGGGSQPPAGREAGGARCPRDGSAAASAAWRPVPGSASTPRLRRRNSGTLQIPAGCRNARSVSHRPAWDLLPAIPVANLAAEAAGQPQSAVGAGRALRSH